MAAGLYDITNETLGKGHFAVVKLAKHCLTEELVAVKIIDKARLNNEGLQQLGLEIRVLSRLSEQEHPNIVKLYQVIDTKTKLYLVMEHCGHEVCDLYDYIQKRNCGNGLKESEAKHIFKQICSAIAYCHSLRIVHRDLKPENILIVTQPDEENSVLTKSPLVKLIDFGFSNQWDEGEKLRTSCGSLAYSAPEILLGDQYDGDKVDIWGLGCILYILLYGSNPFMQINDSETLIRILDCTFSTPPRPTVSDASINLIKSLLKRDPKSRLTVHQILQHPWLNDNGESVARLDNAKLYISGKVQPKSNLHNHVIDQMIAQKMCASRDHIEQALRKSQKQRTSDHIESKEEHELQNCVNGEKESFTLSNDNYITATYHLLKDKLMRELHNANANNTNLSNVSHHPKRVLPPRPRKQLIQQPPRFKPGFIVEENDDPNSAESNSTSPLVETPSEEERFFLPLARKCSVVSEEGSCAGTDHSGTDGGSERLCGLDKFELGGSYPSVDIVVTDCDDLKDDAPTQTDALPEEPVDTVDIAKPLSSIVPQLHLVSSSPELLREDNGEKNLPESQRSATHRPSSMVVKNVYNDESHNDISQLFIQKNQQNSHPSSTSMRVIMQSKSCNNILLSEDSKSTKKRSEGQNNDRGPCQKLVKRKTERTDCCHIC